MLRKSFLYFLCSIICRYAWIHNFHYVNTLGCINDFMMGKYFCKRLYYLQRPVRFINFLANPFDLTYFIKESSLYVYHLLLVISLFFKVYIFCKYYKYILLPVVSIVRWLRLGCKRSYLSLGEQIATYMEQWLKVFRVNSKLLCLSRNHYSYAWHNC